MKPSRALRTNLTSFIGIMLCARSAALLSLVFQNRQSKFVVPIVFLAVVVFVSVRCGVTAGVLGSTAATLVFAIFLYTPLGSPQVENKTARSNLSWMILGGVTISYLVGSPSGRQPHS